MWLSQESCTVPPVTTLRNDYIHTYVAETNLRNIAVRRNDFFIAGEGGGEATVRTRPMPHALSSHAF